MANKWLVEGYIPKTTTRKKRDAIDKRKVEMGVRSDDSDDCDWLTGEVAEYEDNEILEDID